MNVIYDPKKIYLFANRMYSDALASEVFGGVLGLFCLFAAWFVIHEAPNMFSDFNAREYAGQTWALGITLCVMAALAGHSRAENLRAQAQLLLCQMEVERNTANFVHEAIGMLPIAPVHEQEVPATAPETVAEVESGL